MGWGLVWAAFTQEATVNTSELVWAACAGSPVWRPSPGGSWPAALSGVTEGPTLTAGVTPQVLSMGPVPSGILKQWWESTLPAVGGSSDSGGGQAAGVQAAEGAVSRLPGEGPGRNSGTRAREGAWRPHTPLLTLQSCGKARPCRGQTRSASQPCRIVDSGWRAR